MKIGNLLFVTIFFTCFSCAAQKNSHDEFYSHKPCFYCEHPKVITLPDSLKLKQSNLYIEFDFTCYYDSTGKVIEIEPQALYIKNGLFTSTGEYLYYWEDAEKRAKNITKEVAMKYANWAKIEFPRIIKFMHYPANFKCTQNVTNKNQYSLNLKLK